MRIFFIENHKKDNLSFLFLNGSSQRRRKLFFLKLNLIPKINPWKFHIWPINRQQLNRRTILKSALSTEATTIDPVHPFETSLFLYIRLVSSQRGLQALSRLDSTLKLTEFSYRNCASRPESGLCIQRRLKRGKIVLRIIANYFSLVRDQSSLNETCRERRRIGRRESTFGSFSFVLPEVRWTESVETIFLPSKSRLGTVFVSKTAVKSRRFSRDSIEPKRFYNDDFTFAQLN